MTAPAGPGLDVLLRTLKLPSFVSSHAETARTAEREGWGFERYLHALAEQEIADREVRSSRMTSKFTIQSRDDGATLSLVWDSRDFWTAELSGPGLTARRNVDAHPAHGDFRALFEEMAREWRGWKGEKKWNSIEGNLALACTHDGLGHIEVHVELGLGVPSAWRASGSLIVEAGQLDALARAATRFLDEGKHLPAWTGSIRPPITPP
jgi:hypothetical protein